MKKLLIIGGAVIGVLAIAFIALTSGLSDGAKVVINGVNITSIPDGSYTGEYNAGRWSNTVNVQVNDGKITAIEIVDDVAAAWVTNASGEIIRRVVEEQNTTVDAVSGATVTSKAYGHRKRFGRRTVNGDKEKIWAKSRN